MALVHNTVKFFHDRVNVLGLKSPHIQESISSSFQFVSFQSTQFNLAMALFEKPSHHHILSLLRIGFTSRLRSEVADIFISVDEKGTVVRNDSRSSSNLFHFVSNDSSNITPCKESLPFSALVTVLAKSSTDQSKTSFLTLKSLPCLTDSPTLLKVALVRAPNPRRLLFSLSTPGPSPTYLSLSGVRRDQHAITTQTCTKHALFHFEILPESIGKIFFSTSVPKFTEFVLPSQAFILALLHLGVRFRLRSTHATLLSCHDLNSSSGSNSGLLCHLSGSSDTRSGRSLVFSAFSRGIESLAFDPLVRFYTVVHADSNRPLNLELTNSSSSLVASLVSPDLESPIVAIRPTEHVWGGISVGSVRPAANSQNTSILWLMACPDGHLEGRMHRRDWELFTVEFVAQSLNAAIQELPNSELYEAAEKMTRAEMRAAIEKRISNISPGSKLLSDNVTKSQSDKQKGFNHVAALTALSETDKSKQTNELQSGYERGGSEESDVKAGVRENDTGKRKKELSHSRAERPTELGSTSLPRHTASKKAAKKNRKKKNRVNRNLGPTEQEISNNHSATVPSSTKPDKGDDSKRSTIDSGPNSSEPSTASLSSPNAPPCAACGRPLSGVYTKALGKDFHSHCFCCGMCRRPMSPSAGQFRERNGTPYCQTCYATHIAARCARCSQPILETVITAMDKTWHKNCLTCVICRLPVTETFWLYADRPNEPRCSRCVTGEEHSLGRRSNSRLSNTRLLGDSQGTLGASSEGNGRARLLTSPFPSFSAQ